MARNYLPWDLISVMLYWLLLKISSTFNAWEKSICVGRNDLPWEFDECNAILVTFKDFINFSCAIVLATIRKVNWLLFCVFISV